jgi:parallel beta-helix repeat protein
MCTSGCTYQVIAQVIARRAASAFGLALLGFSMSCGGGDSVSLPPDPLYVSVNGDDENPGDRTAPMASISAAARRALDGYTIIVSPGIYEEAVTTDRQGTPAQELAFVADVTGELAGTAPGNVVIRAPLPLGDTEVTAFKLNSSADTVIDGFQITRGGGGGIVINNSPGARVQNCVIFDNRGRNGDGIRVQNSFNVTLFNNLIYRNSSAGIRIAGTPGSGNAQVLNNTLYRNGQRGVSVGNTEAASTGTFLRNNILHSNGNADVIPLNVRVITDPPSTTGYSGDFNVVFPATYAPASLANAARNDVNEDPLFVNPDDRSNPNFRVDTASLALDAGTRSIGSDTLADCLVLWSIAADGGFDEGRIDIGYHYPQGGAADIHCGIEFPE